MRFQWAGGGRAIEKGGLEHSFTSYVAEDGIGVQRSVYTYNSPNTAENEIGALVKQAKEVIEKGSKVAWDGRTVGQRVVLTLNDPNGELKATVAWTDATRLIVLRSFSLRHVLDFEEQDYPAAKPVSPRTRGSVNPDASPDMR